MPSEILKFTYILNVSNLTVPITIGATLNNSVVGSAVISNNGKFEFAAETELKAGTCELSLLVGETNRATVTVNSIKMQWLQENSNINPIWTGREPGPNEVWNYGAPASAPVWSAQINASYHGTIMLEYEQDNRRSFLRSYATVSTGGKTFNLRDQIGAYAFCTPGSFTLSMTSPVSYWLMKRLFVEI
jgi:hypothetical protein